jgi:RNA polymerase sigma factor (sigma-70 family)
MDERDWLAERFEEHRSRLRAVAYRMLGSVSEADDAVQEAWLRLNRSDESEIENLGAWLTTVVGRISLNMLRSRDSRREQPLGVHARADRRPRRSHLRRNRGPARSASQNAPAAGASESSSSSGMPAM